MYTAEFTQEQVDKAMEEIANMDHYTMCQMWRNAPIGQPNIYFRNDLPTGKAFSDRLFNHFGGFTPAISKSIGWNG